MPQQARFGVLTALGLSVASPAPAHHSPVQYDESVIVEKDATVVRFEFRNPHTYILVSDSENAEWLLETSSAVRLRRQGWSADSFSPGDQVSFRAHANNDPKKSRLYLSSITDSNGQTFTLLERGGEEPESEPATAAASLSGTWQVDPGNFREVYEALEATPLTDKALRARAEFNETMDPVADCVAYPTPQLVMVSFIYPMKIELSDEKAVFHHEFFNTTRTVYLDGRGHAVDTPRTNQGHAVGHWDGTTLVVDTRYFADHRNPMLGDFPSGAGKHVIERYTLSDDGTRAVVNIFVEDPEYLAKPMTYDLNLLYAPDEELQDFDCDPEIAKRYTE